MPLIYRSLVLSVFGGGDVARKLISKYCGTWRSEVDRSPVKAPILAYFVPPVSAAATFGSPRSSSSTNLSERGLRTCRKKATFVVMWRCGPHCYTLFGTQMTDLTNPGRDQTMRHYGHVHGSPKVKLCARAWHPPDEIDTHCRNPSRTPSGPVCPKCSISSHLPLLRFRGNPARLDIWRIMRSTSSVRLGKLLVIPGAGEIQNLERCSSMAWRRAREERYVVC